MGVKNLPVLLQHEAAACVTKVPLQDYSGRRLAVDGPLVVYQLVTALSFARNGFNGFHCCGKRTTHIHGAWHRTIRMMADGVEPVFVFDGEAPALKAAEVARRSRVKARAKNRAEKASTSEAKLRALKATVRVTPEEHAEVGTLLRLMGVPVVDAPGEAEAQCAELAKGGAVYGVITEDMDCLAFGAPRLLRHFSYNARWKGLVLEYSREAALAELEMTEKQFVDLCVLLGTDYCPNIPKLGWKSVLKAMRADGKSVEDVLGGTVVAKGYKLPDPYSYEEARELMTTPLVTPAAQVPIAFSAPDLDGLRRFLVTENGMREREVDHSMRRLVKAHPLL